MLSSYWWPVPGNVRMGQLRSPGCHEGSEAQLFKKTIIYVFMAVLGLCYCAWAFSICGEWELLSSLW